MSEIQIFYPFSIEAPLDNGYELKTLDMTVKPLTKFTPEINQAVSVNVKVVMRSQDSDNYGQFVFSSVFCNNDGVLSEKNPSDTVVNRDNENNKCLFEIAGNEISVNCYSGLNKEVNWYGIVEILPV